MIDKWDIRFMKIAQEFASWSKDPKRKVGAAIVNPATKQIVAGGFNGFPRGCNDDYNCDPETKANCTVHAEINAILSADIQLKGFTLYTTFYPCAQCACAIIQKGISRIVYHEEARASSKWHAKQLSASKLFREARTAIIQC